MTSAPRTDHIAELALAAATNAAQVTVLPGEAPLEDVTVPANGRILVLIGVSGAVPEEFPEVTFDQEALEDGAWALILSAFVAEFGEVRVEVVNPTASDVVISGTMLARVVRVGGVPVPRPLPPPVPPPPPPPLPPSNDIGIVIESDPVVNDLLQIDGPATTSRIEIPFPGARPGDVAVVNVFGPSPFGTYAYGSFPPHVEDDRIIAFFPNLQETRSNGIVVGATFTAQIVRPTAESTAEFLTATYAAPSLSILSRAVAIMQLAIPGIEAEDIVRVSIDTDIPDGIGMMLPRNVPTIDRVFLAIVNGSPASITLPPITYYAQVIRPAPGSPNAISQSIQSGGPYSNFTPTGNLTYGINMPGATADDVVAVSMPDFPGVPDGLSHRYPFARADGLTVYLVNANLTNVNMPAMYFNSQIIRGPV